MMELKWIKCRGNVWYRLNKLDLKKILDDEGVYVIWYEDNEDIEGIVGKELIDTFGEKNAFTSVKVSLKIVLKIIAATMTCSAIKVRGRCTSLGLQFPPSIGTAWRNILPISLTQRKANDIQTLSQKR